MAPEIGSLRALSNGESQFVGSSSGVYFINTVRKAFSTADDAPSSAVVGTDEHGENDLQGNPSPEDCIVGGQERADLETPRGSQGDAHDRVSNCQPEGRISPFPVGINFFEASDNLPEYEIARRLVMTYFRIWHPLVPFLKGHECLKDLDALYSPDFDKRNLSSMSTLITFRCIFNIARLENAVRVDLGSATIHSPSDLLPALSLLALRCDTPSIQALLSAQVYFVSTMSLRHASSVSGLLSKSIFQSGMHRCPFRYDHLSPDERAMRKRMFWSFYVLDRFISQSLGHPNGIQDSDIDVCPPGPGDLHEPVSSLKDSLGNAPATNTSLHLPVNHPDRLAESTPTQVRVREPTTESDHEDGTTGTPADASGDEAVFARSAAIDRHRRETQAVLENHVRHSQLVGRILEVFHKSIHARDMDTQTILFLKADVAAFGNELTQPRLSPSHSAHIPELTPDPTVFPFISYHYAVLLFNRPSLSLDSRRAEFRSALQTSVRTAKTIIHTIEQYAENGGPLFWPGYMSAAWMSGLVLALAARLNLYSSAKAIRHSSISSSLNLLESMTKRWSMANHCKEVLFLLLQSIENGSKSRKRGRCGAQLEPDPPKRTRPASPDLHTRTGQRIDSQRSSKRQVNGVRGSDRQAGALSDEPLSPWRTAPAIGKAQRTQVLLTPTNQQEASRDWNKYNYNRAYAHHDRDGFQFSRLGSYNDCYQFQQPIATQFAGLSELDFLNNAPLLGSQYPRIPTTFPDRGRNDHSPFMDQIGGGDALFNVFDGATWGSLLDIVNDAGAEV
ncbi:putative transcriptional regulatory protein YJL206C-like protein 3 [Colletotrichum chlorophyti]|uniref:Putative transcriptional regulatory protein YJL206C-like protein 3 n=1 Tax=Colletotrichum chlorophyti TaxID=708187 RepID=A0A1Q8S678_9PEZI|nr:putative transcriptional regulatory protein YJL206C-like protein 3 [Colletotrichum chlorophyti]